eukprot:9388349-Heterocapsa_arctica.AAC.1
MRRMLVAGSNTPPPTSAIAAAGFAARFLCFEPRACGPIHQVRRPVRAFPERPIRIETQSACFLPRPPSQ